MQKSFLQKVKHLPLEEKILNGASALGIMCIFFPWVSGEWLGGNTVSHSGVGFFTSFIGMMILALLLSTVLITALPLAGVQLVIPQRKKGPLRLMLLILASILTICVWSVLTKFTFEFSRLQINFGLYGTLVNSMIASLYAFLHIQDQREPRSYDAKTRTEEEVFPEAPDVEDHRIR